MCNLGFQFLLETLRRAGCETERLFLEAEAIPAPGRGGDLLLFHASYEPDLLRLPFLLRQLGIPLAASRRGESDPFVVLGGPVSLLNPRMVEDLLDLVCVGEGDEALPELLGELTACRTERLDRAATLARLASCPNLQQTPLPIRVHSRRAADPGPAHSQAVSSTYSFRDMFLLEIARGCPRSCPFCLVPACMGRFRPFSADRLRKLAARGRSLTDRLGLAGAAAVYHPEIESLLDEWIALGMRASFSSMYVERINDEFARRLVAMDQRTVTLGLESADPRTRERLGKRFGDGQLLAALESLLRAGIRQVKLYVIFGLPGTEPMAGEAELLCQLQTRIRRELPGLRLSFSVNPFAPKPNTLWGREALPTAEYDKALKQLGRQLDRGVKLNGTGLREAMLCTRINRMRATDWELIEILSRRPPAGLGESLKLLSACCATDITAALDAGGVPWPELVLA